MGRTTPNHRRERTATRRVAVILQNNRSEVAVTKTAIRQETMKLKTLLSRIAISVVAAGPVGGFIFGLMNAGDPDPNPVGRIMYACLMSVQSSLHLGFTPSQAGGSVQSLNLWPHIAVAFGVIFATLVSRDLRLHAWRNKRTKE